MSGLAATMRSAACWRTSSQLRTGRAAAARLASPGGLRRGGRRWRGAAPRGAPRCRRDRRPRADDDAPAPAAASTPADDAGRAGALAAFNAGHDRSPRRVLAKCLRRVDRSSTLAWPTPRAPPKRCSSFARFFGPTPAMSSSRLAPVRTLARRARMPVIAKRCASSRICATSISAAESRPSATLGRPSAKTSSSSPTLRPSPFSTPTMRGELDAELLEHLARDADLAAAAVDQDEVGQARRALARRLDQLGVAARQHLAHRRVVVARGDAGDVVAPVLRALHLVRLEDDARRLGRLAGGVADVEALDPERMQVLDLEVERVDQGAGARLLRAFLGEQLGQAERGAVDAHVEPGAARLARLVLRPSP